MPPLRPSLLAFLGALLLYAAPAHAQTTATLTGTVTDAATKQPVADVVVTVTSPNLQGEQVVVTDATGSYRIPQLPPGTYTARMEKERYKTLTKTGIKLKVDTTTRLNAQLVPTSGSTSAATSTKKKTGGTTKKQ